MAAKSAALLSLGVFVLALWAQSDALVGVFYDDGIYVMAGKALAEGHGYRHIHLPDALPGVHHPPLYPLMLALAWRLWPAFPQNVTLFQLLDAACLAGAAWIMASHAARLGLSVPVRMSALALGFAAFPLLAILGIRLSEPLFLLLAVGAVALADRQSVSPTTALAAGALAGGAVLARAVGVSVLAGVVAALWFRRERRAALICLATGALLVLPWTLWVATHAAEVDPRLANYTTYLHEARQAGATAILGGLKLRAVSPLLELALPRVPPWGFYPLAGLVLGLVGWGAVHLSRKAPALIASLGFYLVVVSLWPFTPDRFVWIVLPWLALVAAAGCREAWSRGRWSRVVVVVALAAVAAGYLPREARALADRGFAWRAAAMSQPFRLLRASVVQETPASAVIASEEEPLLSLYTGRRTVPSHLFRWSGLGTTPLPAAARIAYWCEQGVTHLVVTAPLDPTSAIVEEAGAVPLFQVTDGPGLYRFRCPG